MFVSTKRKLMRMDHVRLVAGNEERAVASNEERAVWDEV